MTNGNLMKLESIAECSRWILGLENLFSVFLRVAVSHRFHCNHLFSIRNSLSGTMCTYSYLIDIQQMLEPKFCIGGQLQEFSARINNIPMFHFNPPDSVCSHAKRMSCIFNTF